MSIFLISREPGRKRTSNVLRIPQLNNLTTLGPIEQMPIMRRLLDHIRMQRIPLRPLLTPVIVRLQHPREPGLRGRVRGVVRGAGELVERDGGGQGGERDVETAAEGFVHGFRVMAMRGGWGLAGGLGVSA